MKASITQSNKHQAVVNFIFDKPVKYKVFKLSSPERVVIDLDKTSNRIKLTGKRPAFFKNLRYAKHNTNDLRIVIDMQQPVKYQTTLKGRQLQVALQTRTGIKKEVGINKKNLDSKSLEGIKLQLLSAHDELGALKVQNQLLREQLTASDIPDTERTIQNNLFSVTIAALNSDIGQLRIRIKELEELEVMKDNHISELQKALDHATAVIKEQAEVNKKMYVRLNQLENL